MSTFARTATILTMLCLGTLPMGCDDEPHRVTPDDIRVSKGPDGTSIFLPADDSAAASGYAQWLQLRADLAGISSTGDFLDTQVANLHLQEDLLGRARGADWTWAKLHGSGDVDFDAAIKTIQNRLEQLDPDR